MLRFTDNRFKFDHDITIGVEFGAEEVRVGKYLVKIQIWDTANQESFRSIARSYYRELTTAPYAKQQGGEVAINPITNKDSFINTVRWLNEIKEQANNHICITLVGNKSDLEAHRSVKAEEAREFAYSNELLFIEASALSGFNVEKTFTIGIAQILNKLENGDIDMTKDHTGIRMGTTLKKKVCCG